MFAVANTGGESATIAASRPISKPEPQVPTLTRSWKSEAAPLVLLSMTVACARWPALGISSRSAWVQLGIREVYSGRWMVVVVTPMW